MQKDVGELIAEAERQGWEAKQRKSGHWMLFPPNAMPPVVLASTPSDYRWRRNAIALMRRAGFVWPPRKE